MNKKNQLICDITTGHCGDEEEGEAAFSPVFAEDALTLYYVTDPICSHCWAFEPVLRRFLDQYGHLFKTKIVFGGLLEKWHGGTVDAANGISGPADVAPHWREVGLHARMPIDGSVMIDNPVASSYPPSKVIKVVQSEHGEQMAMHVLRKAREALFLNNRNIGETAVMQEVLTDMGFDGDHLVKRSEGPEGERLLQEDFKLKRTLGARAFPTIILMNHANEAVNIVGSRPFHTYVEGLTRLLGEAPEAKAPLPLQTLLETEQLLFSKEIEVMYDLAQEDLPSYVKHELIDDSYTWEEFLGERAIKLEI